MSIPHVLPQTRLQENQGVQRLGRPHILPCEGNGVSGLQYYHQRMTKPDL